MDRRCAMRAVARLAIAAAAVLAAGASAFAAERLKVGSQKTVSPIYIAQAKGYFAAQGLEVELVYFEAALPIASAVVSGDVDIGISGLTGAVYSLAEQGQLRLIAGQTHEMPGYRANTVAASNKAYAAGLRSFKDLPGHSVAVTQIGSAFHYDLGLLAEKYGFDLKTIRILPLQTNPNSVAAVTGGSADAAISLATYLMPAIDRGNAKLIGFIGDEAPWQLAALYVAMKTANERQDMVAKFLAAFRTATRDYHDAFTGPDGARRDGPTAPAIVDIIAKATGEPADWVKGGIGYIDADARIDVKDIDHQVEWFKAQNLLKGSLRGAQLIDMRYALPLGG